MIVSLDWLADHINLEGLTVDDVARLLTFAGVEVEDVQQRGVASDKVVVARIVEFKKHPDADKLSVCLVETGQPGRLNIVCGARNFAAGDKVPLAFEGAVLPGGFTIKKTRMRGVESEGMLCSGKELGVSEDAEGLLILSSEAPLGRPLGEILGTDTLLHLEVTPNRPDLLSHRGIARELAAITGRPLRRRRVGGLDGSVPETAPNAVAAGDDVIRLEAPAGCPFYSGRIIRRVQVAASPDWLRRRLESIGLRPINNVVDITNYVLHDVGQPLHAFDLSKVELPIVIRHARAEEKLLALDEATYALTPDDVVIADGKKSLAIAGVMGGAETGVTEATTDIFLEAACFAPALVRRTSRRLGLSSDSSYRFERGVDPEGVLAGSVFATHLLEELTRGRPEAETIVVGKPSTAAKVIPLTPAHVAKWLGISLPEEKVAAILSGLGLLATDAGWRVPSFRLDLERPVDLIEEIARLAGLDAIPSRAPGEFAASSRYDATYDFLLGLKQKLVTVGFYEARTLKFNSETQLAHGFGLPPGEPLRLKNPISDEHVAMRSSVLPGLIEVAAQNIRQGAEALRFFEAGTVFAPPARPDEGASEKQALALLMSGPHVPTSWLKKAPHPVDFFDLRGLVESIIGRTGLQLKRTRHSSLVVATDISLRNKVLGVAGQLAPSKARAFDARHPVYLAEIDLGLLETMLGTTVRFQELTRFPAVTRDVALEVGKDVSHREIEAFFEKQRRAERLLEAVELFDVFMDPSGQRLSPDKKSLAFALTYRDPSGTLEAAEIDALHQRIVTALVKTIPASVR